MAVDIDGFNESVQQWTKETESLLKNTAHSFGIQHRSQSPSKRDSVNQIKGSVRKAGGITNRVGFKFPRHLVFVHKGAGRGYGGAKGSRWVDARGVSHKTNPKSLGKQGTGNRREKPWLNSALGGPEGVDKLATIAAEQLGDYITGNFLIN